LIEIIKLPRMTLVFRFTWRERFTGIERPTAWLWQPCTERGVKVRAKAAILAG